MPDPEDLVHVEPEDVEELLEESPSSFWQNLFLDGPLGRILGKVNEWLDRHLTGRREAAQAAGIDLEGTRRRFGARLWRTAARRSALRSRGSLDSPEDFARLLQPLSPADVILLQKEIRADRTILAQLDEVRGGALHQQRKGMLLGMLLGILFALLAGPDYVLETIYRPGSEAWGAVVFALGILLPMMAFFQVAEGARLLFLYQEDPRSSWKRAGLILIILPLLALLLLLLGAVPLAAAPILLAWAWSRAERKQE